MGSTLVNNLVNQARDWGQKINPETEQAQGLVKRFVAPRVAMVGVGVADVAQIAKNAFIGVVQAPGVVVHTGLNVIAKVVSLVSNTEVIKNVADKFPGLTDFLKTVANVVSYAIAHFAAVVGIVLPSVGIYIHDKLGISGDSRAANVLAEAKKIPASTCTNCPTTVAAVEADLHAAGAHAKSFAKSVKDDAHKVAHAIKADAHKAAHAVKEDAKAVAHAVKADAQHVAHAIETGAHNVAAKVEHVASEAASLAKSAATEIENAVHTPEQKAAAASESSESIDLDVLDVTVDAPEETGFTAYVFNKASDLAASATNLFHKATGNVNI